jgi:hypothetical protein
MKIVFPRQMLHAELLGFVHPATGEYMEFISEIPHDMKEKIVLLGKNKVFSHIEQVKFPLKKGG